MAWSTTSGRKKKKKHQLGEEASFYQAILEISCLGQHPYSAVSRNLDLTCLLTSGHQGGLSLRRGNECENDKK